MPVKIKGLSMSSSSRLGFSASAAGTFLRAATEAAGSNTAETADKGRAAMVLAADAVGTGALAGDDTGALAGAAAPVVALPGWSAAMAALAPADAGDMAALARAAGVGATSIGAAGRVETLTGAEGFAAGSGATGNVVAGGWTATAAGISTATPDAGARRPLAAAVAAAEAAPSLFRSLMFFDKAATRDAESLACRAVAICCSVDVAGLPAIASLESVNLSGTVLAGARSSTLACSFPLACRSALVRAAVGTLLARLRRNALKSALCATMV